MPQANSAKKRREKKIVDKGQCHIQSTFNNTIITITDMKGGAISWASAGEMGFKGSKSQLLLQHRPLLKLQQKLRLTEE